MTIKKIGLSLVAISMIGTAGFAGTVKNPGSIGLIGSEKLSLQDVNITAVFGDAFTSLSTAIEYTPADIPATSLKNPIFKFTYANAKDLVASSTTAVFEVQDGNASNAVIANYKMVAKTPQISGSNNNIISFNAVDSNTYAYNNKLYVVADSNTTDANGTASVQATVVKGSTSDLTLQAELYSGDSQAQADLAPATSIAKVGAEYVGSVVQKYNARIDASNSFYTFYDQYSDTYDVVGDNKHDSANFSLKKNATLSGASLRATQVNLVITYDQNLTKNSATVTASGAVTIAAAAPNDNNATLALSSIFTTNNLQEDKNETVEFAVDGTSEIKKTIFDAHAYVTSGTSTFDLIPKTSGNAGQWTIYGYNAQIPNAVSINGGQSFETVMKFTNRSSIPTDIFFTLIDQDGTVETVSSKNTTLANIPVNGTGVYTATELLALVTNPDFDKSKSFSVEVSIPTTPSSVYGFASFKNVTLGQFKDLPIYNSSSMTY